MALSKAERANLAFLRTECGWLYDRLAQLFGVPRSSVRRILVEEGQGVGTSREYCPLNGVYEEL